MNINQIDEYLYLKSKLSIDEFFDYLSIPLKILKENASKVDFTENKKIFKSYNKEVVDYQIKTSSLILNLTHIIELLLKSILYRKGEYLIYESIDNYPLEKEKLNKKRKDYKKKLSKLRDNITSLISNNRKENLSKLSYDWISLLIKDEEFILPHSITLLNAINRLQIFFNYDFQKKFISKFEELVSCRNEIIHFGHFRNVTLGCGLALHCLLNLCNGLIEKDYPKLVKLVPEYSEMLKSYTELIPFIISIEMDNKIINELELISKKYFKVN